MVPKVAITQWSNNLYRNNNQKPLYKVFDSKQFTENDLYIYISTIYSPYDIYKR